MVEPTDPKAVESFIAVLFFIVMGGALLIVGAVHLFGRIGERFGWFYDEPAGPGPAHTQDTPSQPRPQAADVDTQPVVVAPVSAPAAVVAATSTATTPHNPPQPAPVDATTPLPPTPTAEWVALLNDQPDQAPHLVIVGGSGTGKTTLATALLTTRPGKILIITPKTDDLWGGLPFVTIDDDGSFTTAAHIFSQLLGEVKRRLVASKRRQDTGPWLTVVLDDYPALRSACPDADPAFLLVAQLGRSLRVRLIVLSYSGLVKELGLEGRGESRNHFVWLRLDRQRRATLEWDDVGVTLDTCDVPRLARQPISADRWWSPPTPGSEAPTTALERPEWMIEPTPTTTTSPPVGVPHSPAEPVVVVDVVPREGVVLTEQVAILSAAVTMRQSGVETNRTEVCRQVFEGQTGGAAYRKVKAVLDAAGL